MLCFSQADCWLIYGNHALRSVCDGVHHSRTEIPAMQRRGGTCIWVSDGPYGPWQPPKYRTLRYCTSHLPWSMRLQRRSDLPIPEALHHALPGTDYVRPAQRPRLFSVNLKVFVYSLAAGPGLLPSWSGGRVRVRRRHGTTLDRAWLT
jgi:hypothetical protein